MIKKILYQLIKIPIIIILGIIVTAIFLAILQYVFIYLGKIIII